VLSLYGAIVHLQFSHAYYASEFTRARAVADRLVAILRDDPRFYLTDAFRASKDGDSLASLAAFQSSVDFYPTPEGYRGLGLAHYRRSEFAQAESAFRTGLALNDREGRTHHQLGKLLVATGRLREGVARLERAQQLLPTDVVIGVDLAAARILLQRENRP
jgi:Flp pilus assembly protein TadD